MRNDPDRQQYIQALSRLKTSELREMFAQYLTKTGRLPQPAAKKQSKTEWLVFDEATERRIQDAKDVDSSGDKSWLAAVKRLPHSLLVPPAMNAQRLEELRLIWDSQVVGLEEVYEILLVQAVNYARTQKARPLLLVGTPGCGKSTVSEVYAQMLGLPKYRISCPHLGNGGGLAGDRPVYRGSDMGALMKGVCACGCGNPLFVLDEIDKVSATSSVQDPSFSAVLMNLLDGFGDQFRDSFLGFTADLSHAPFCLVANELEGLPAPLIDRCQVIRFPEPDKAQLTHILAQFTLPRACEGRKDVSLCPEAAAKMVEQGWPAGLRSPRQYDSLAAQLCGAAELDALRSGKPVCIDQPQIAQGILRLKKDTRPSLGFARQAG